MVKCNIFKLCTTKYKIYNNNNNMCVYIYIYTHTHTHTHNLGYVEVLSENEISKVS